MSKVYDAKCKACPRLVQFLSDVKDKYPDYFCGPVPPFGDAKARVLVVGLAPGMHGANATGRPFTGDHAGILLYQTLHKFGYASADESVSIDDGLKLKNCRITNAVKCLPPENKPTTAEARECNHFLQADLASLPDNGVILALGKIAHDAVLRTLGLKLVSHKFAHGASHVLESGVTLVDSYHCSRYNTNTGRLTESMFHDVFDIIKSLTAKNA